jgi:hypothetical protein
MPNVLDLIQSNPEIAQALPKQPIEPSSDTDNMGSTYGVSPETAQYIAPPSWASMRRGRTNAMLGNEGFQNLLAQHHATVADTEATARAAEALFSFQNMAQSHQETADFLHSIHGLRADAPNYENTFLQGAIDYPHADWKRIHEAVAPLHESRRAFMAMHSAAAEREQQNEIFKAMAKGSLKAEDFSNPDNQMNGSLNYGALRALAATREASSPEGLSTAEREMVTKFQDNPNLYKQLDARAAKGDQLAIANKNAYWTAMKKLDPDLANRLKAGGAPAAAAAATVARTAPTNPTAESAYSQLLGRQ